MGFFWDPPIQKFGTRVVKNPWFVVPKGCFLLANWGENFVACIRKHCNVEGSIEEQAAATWGNQQKSLYLSLSWFSWVFCGFPWGFKDFALFFSTDISANIVHVIKARWRQYSLPYWLKAGVWYFHPRISTCFGPEPIVINRVMS